MWPFGGYTVKGHILFPLFYQSRWLPQHRFSGHLGAPGGEEERPTWLVGPKAEDGTEVGTERAGVLCWASDLDEVYASPRILRPAI